MLAPIKRIIAASLPSGSITRGVVPVVLATVLLPPARSPAAMRRVTLDLPRVPLT